jgi:hypothetical protein
MARKLADEGGSGSGETPDDGPSDRRDDTTLARREYVRAGAALVSTATVSGFAAASEETSDPPGAPECRLLFSGTGAISKYEFTVGGELVSGTDANDAAVGISGCSAEGVIKNGERTYRFSGEIRDIIVYGDAGVYLEGSRIGGESSMAEELHQFREEFPAALTDR